VVRTTLSHDVEAKRTVRHLGTDVEGMRPTLDRFEILGKALPAPIDAFRQRRTRNVLDPLHQLDQVVVRSRTHRREPHTAVAHHHTGDTMPTGRRQQRVPGCLPVVVGVDIDPAGSYEQTIGVDLTPGGLFQAPHRDDLPSANAHVAREPRPPAPIHHGPAANRQIEHDTLV
jgi:hypothetical protein